MVSICSSALNDVYSPVALRVGVARQIQVQSCRVNRTRELSESCWSWAPAGWKEWVLCMPTALVEPCEQDHKFAWRRSMSPAIDLAMVFLSENNIQAITGFWPLKPSHLLKPWPSFLATILPTVPQRSKRPVDSRGQPKPFPPLSQLVLLRPLAPCLWILQHRWRCQQHAWIRMLRSQWILVR